MSAWWASTMRAKATSSPPAARRISPAEVSFVLLAMVTIAR